MCEAAGGTWNGKKCKCKNINGKTITTEDPDECFIEVIEEPVDEEPLPEYKYMSKSISCGPQCTIFEEEPLPKYKQGRDEDRSTEQIMCEAADGTWNGKKCKCKNIKGKTITTEDPDECFIEVEEEYVEEEPLPEYKQGRDEDQEYENTSKRISCEAAGGKWNGKKCKCKNIKGKTITTSDPKQCFIEVEEEYVDE